MNLPSVNIRPKAVKAKRPFMPKYPQYDTANGFGSSQEWKENYFHRLGLPEAERVVNNFTQKDTDLLAPMRIAKTFDEVAKAYRRLAMQYHPDRGGDLETMKRINAMMEVLEDKFKRRK